MHFMVSKYINFSLSNIEQPFTMLCYSLMLLLLQLLLTLKIANKSYTFLVLMGVI